MSSCQTGHSNPSLPACGALLSQALCWEALGARGDPGARPCPQGAVGALRGPNQPGSREDGIKKMSLKGTEGVAETKA